MVLQVNHISKAFGSHQVLHDTGFSLDPGQALALLGANGAGKTTLLRIVTGILQPDAGEVLFEGHPLQQADLAQIGYLPEERGLYRRMRAGEQVCYMARLKGLSRSAAEAAAREWFNRLGAADWYRLPVNRLSKGMQQKVQLIATLVHRPRLVILDEPFSGLDQANADLLRGEVLRLKASGTAFIISTHNLQAAADLCDKTLQL
ncbi:MAG: ATP-binding cassette domain-containing protein [Bacteroidales bacterium]|nr:ATP-binding cassette domain-containing protein [Bacteroidales bacterium]